MVFFYKINIFEVNVMGRKWGEGKLRDKGWDWIDMEVWGRVSYWLDSEGKERDERDMYIL